jgi:hypothetical protein
MLAEVYTKMINQQSITLITAIIGAVCGVSGAILGIINTCNQLSKNKVRLKVTPIHVIPVGAIENLNINFGIEVINLSDFPVTISDVGFLLKNKKRATLGPVIGVDQPKELPVRLEPRTSYKKYFNIDRAGLPKRTKCAYVTTECGELITGTSGALKQKIKETSV